MDICRRVAALLLMAAVVAAAEDIRFITSGERYYLKGWSQDEPVTVTIVDRDANRVKIRKSDGVVDWVAPSELVALTESKDRDTVRLGVGAVLLGALICGATDACKSTPTVTEQKFTLCNKASRGKVYAAVTYQKQSQWQTQGWYVIEEGSCAVVATGFTGDRLYYFARNSRGSAWGGDTPICVDPVSAFTAASANKCSGSYVSEGFKEYRVDPSRKMLVNLTE